MSLIQKLAEKALATLKQRGEQNSYDKKPGSAQEERSAAQIARVFNELTGHNLSTTDAWTFLQVLKLVRMENQIKTGSGDLLDSCNDMISYSLLKAETALEEHRPAQVEELNGTYHGSLASVKERFAGTPTVPFVGFRVGNLIETGNHPALSEEQNDAFSRIVDEQNS